MYVKQAIIVVSYYYDCPARRPPCRPERRPLRVPGIRGAARRSVVGLITIAIIIKRNDNISKIDNNNNNNDNNSVTDNNNNNDTVMIMIIAIIKIIIVVILIMIIIMIII